MSWKETVTIMELWDIYDIDRMPTGKTAERGNALSDGEYHAVIHVCIFNSEGKMLIQQRQSTKKGWPDYWDVSCGGCCIAGETTRDAAHRELFEELGIDVDFSALRCSLTMNFDHGFDDFFILNRDMDISGLTLQQEEVQAVKWASMDEIFRMIDDGTFLPFFKSFLQLIFDIRHKPDCFDL